MVNKKNVCSTILEAEFIRTINNFWSNPNNPINNLSEKEKKNFIIDVLKGLCYAYENDLVTEALNKNTDELKKDFSDFIK